MFNIITRSESSIYDYNKCLYYIILVPYAHICFFIAGYLTIINLPSAVYSVTRDRYYNSVYSRICDMLLSIIIGFFFLYNLYYFELLRAL